MGFVEPPYAPSVIISVLKYLLCQTLTLAEQQKASASRSQILGLLLCPGLPLMVEVVPRPPVPGGWQGAAARPLASRPAPSVPTARGSEMPSCTHSRCLLQRGLLKQILQKVRTDLNTDGKSPVCTKRAGGSGEAREIMPRKVITDQTSPFRLTYMKTTLQIAL